MPPPHRRPLHPVLWIALGVWLGVGVSYVAKILPRPFQPWSLHLWP